MEIVNLVAFLLSLIGVLLTSAKYNPYLKPTDSDPKARETYREKYGGIGSGGDVEETLDQYIERRHEISTWLCQGLCVKVQVPS